MLFPCNYFPLNTLQIQVILNGCDFFKTDYVAEEGPLYFIDASTEDAVLTRVLYVDERSDLALLKF